MEQANVHVQSSPCAMPIKPSAPVKRKGIPASEIGAIM